MGMERAIALFGIVPVDRPLQLFYGRRAIALLVSKGRSPLTTFAQPRAIALFGIERSIACYLCFSKKSDLLFK
ncbi:hypothetical protein QUB70_11650 [Microcoleus sp. A003_D6]|uniref:hypothetical protein n=1 Tax=Microcoleus sp. A003_D6 TaxID=3055266 RepID=UPI002FD5A6A5